MSFIFVAEQILNGLQFGVMLFLMAAGLTLILKMGLINLAHGSLYMVGAFAAAAIAKITGSFLLALAAALAASAVLGVLVEIIVMRRLYQRDHLDQVLATFALILIFSEGTRWIFGSFPLYLDIPAYLADPVRLSRVLPIHLIVLRRFWRVGYCAAWGYDCVYAIGHSDLCRGNDRDDWALG